MTGCDSYVGWVLAMKIHYFRHDSNNRCIVMGKVCLHTCMYYTSLTVMSQLIGKAFPKDQCSTCSPLGCTGAQWHCSVCTLHVYGRVSSITLFKLKCNTCRAWDIIIQSGRILFSCSSHYMYMLLGQGSRISEEVW